jgi:hypothetical protein
VASGGRSEKQWVMVSVKAEFVTGDLKNPVKITFGLRIKHRTSQLQSRSTHYSTIVFYHTLLLFILSSLKTEVLSSTLDFQTCLQVQRGKFLKACVLTL